MVQFRRGEFAEFRATEKIHLGKHGVDIMRDDIVEYDGITLRMGPDEFNTTLLRKAIAKGWLVPSSDTTSVYVAQPAGVTVGPADTGNPMDYKNKSRLANNSHTMDVDAMSNEGVVVGGAGFTDFSDPRNKNKTQGRPGAGRRMQVESLDQEGMVVATVSRAPSKNDKLVVTNTAMADRAIRKLDSSQVKRAAIQGRESGSPQPQIDTAGLSDDEAAVLRKLLAKASGGAEPQHTPARQSVVDDDYEPPEDAPWIKSREAAEQAKADAAAAREARLAGMGVNPADSKGRKKAAAPLEVADEDMVVLDDDEPDGEMDINELLSGDEPPDADDIMFDDDDDDDDDDEYEAGPTAEEIEEQVQARLRDEKLSMFQAMFPGFVWDFDLQWRKRVKIACQEHYGKPTLQAIKQMETDAVIKYIEQYEEKRAEQAG